MSAGKTLLRRAFAAAIEAAGYNNGGAVAYPGDAFHVHEDFEVEEQYQFDGQRQGTSPGSSMQASDPKQGRYCDLSLAHRVRPGGAAYSSSVSPTIDRMLRAHGMTKTLVVTAGSESITYKPFTDGTWESLFGEAYVGKEKYVYQAGYVYKVTHTADGLGTPVWMFNLKAPLPARSVDSALPTITAYPGSTVASPKGAGSILTLSAAGGGGAFQGAVRKSTVTSERTIDDRMSQVLAISGAASGHAGFQLGRYTQTMEVSVEATPLAGALSSSTLLDPKAIEEGGTLVTAILGFNQGNQYSRYKFVTGATAQIKEAKKDKAGTIRLWNLTIQLPPSSDVADDGLSVVFD